MLPSGLSSLPSYQGRHPMWFIIAQSISVTKAHGSLCMLHDAVWLGMKDYSPKSPIIINVLQRGKQCLKHIHRQDNFRFIWSMYEVV